MPIQGTIVATGLAGGDAMAFNFGLTPPRSEVRALAPLEDTRSATDRLPGAMGTLLFGGIEQRKPEARPSHAGEDPRIPHPPPPPPARRHFVVASSRSGRLHVAVIRQMALAW